MDFLSKIPQCNTNIYQFDPQTPLYVLSNCMKINSKNDLINNYYIVLILNNFLKTKSQLSTLNC